MIATRSPGITPCAASQCAKPRRRCRQLGKADRFVVSLGMSDTQRDPVAAHVPVHALPADVQPIPAAVEQLPQPRGREMALGVGIRGVVGQLRHGVASLRLEKTKRGTQHVVNMSIALSMDNNITHSWGGPPYSRVTLWNALPHRWTWLSGHQMAAPDSVFGFLPISTAGRPGANSDRVPAPSAASHRLSAPLPWSDRERYISAPSG